VRGERRASSSEKEIFWPFTKEVIWAAKWKRKSFQAGLIALGSPLLRGLRLDKSTHREGTEVDSGDPIVLIIYKLVLLKGVGIRFAKGVGIRVSGEK
jgi:hypothetical protein